MPIFVSWYENDLGVIFDLWPKLKWCHVQPEIRILKVIYFTALQKLEDDLDYEEDSENEDTKDIFESDLRNQTRHIPDKPDADEVLEMFHVDLWGALDELELIRRKFRKCRVGM